MSRIGKMPITLINQAKIEITDLNVRVSGPKGTLEQRLTDQVRISEEGGVVIVTRIDDSKKAKAQHGLYR
ncbi:MAG: 50S ribosomal protein L6, partial [Chlorobium sp.]